MVKDLKAIEKFLQGYKTYLISFGWVIYGVLYTGFHTHQWTGITGAWTYVFSGGGLAAIRAALAVHFEQVIGAILSSNSTTTIVTPVVNPPETKSTP